MLESAFSYKYALYNLFLLDINYIDCPSKEWKKLEKLYTFLKLFYDCINTFSGSLYPTSNLFFNGVWKVQWKLNQEIDSSDHSMRMTSLIMKEKVDKYWKEFNVIFAIAVVLDPRYKMKVVEFAYSKIYRHDVKTCVDIVCRKMHALFEEYRVSSLVSDITSLVGGTSSIVENKDDLMEGYDSFVDSTSMIC